MKVELREIVVNKNRIEYVYNFDELAAVFFNSEQTLFIEYPEDFNFEIVPKSILTIPFVTNLLALSWIFDIEIVIDEIDRSFYNSIATMKDGYHEIFPNVNLKGSIVSQNIIENRYALSNQSTCLFSGGVDATYTFLKHKEEKPILVNIWGVDVGLDDIAGHNEMEDYFKKIANEFHNDYICIKSSVRTFLNEQYLNQCVFKIINDYWWHGAQHSIGMLSLLAPYNYLYKVKTNYIASSFTEIEQNQGVRCISYPNIDSQLKMASTSCFHDGFETQRIGKVKYICEERKKENLDLDIKVCFHYNHGKNCSNCEKCMRTIAAILVFDNQVEKYGFSSKCNDGKKLRRFLDSKEISEFRWKPIQDAYKENPYNNQISWLSTYKFNDMKSFRSRLVRLMEKFYRKV